MKPFLIALLIALAVALAAPDVPQVQPKEVAERIAGLSKPAVFQVGPNNLYRSNHVPGSIFAGPGNRPEGLELLKTEVSKLPKDREIVLYCGCCPWDHCPNITPTVNLLKGMGYTKVKAMYVPQNFKTDWIDKGYPTEKSLQQ